MLLIYILINCPTSAYLTVALLHGYVGEGPQFLFVLGLLISQVNGIFAVHLMGALFSRSLQRPNRLLLSVNAHQMHLNGNLYGRLWDMIQRWHCRNQYGITYRLTPIYGRNYGLTE